MLSYIYVYFGVWWMKVDKYIGTKQEGKCEMCHETSYKTHFYRIVPTIANLVDWKLMIVCKKCAKRELGKGWKTKMEALHE